MSQGSPDPAPSPISATGRIDEVCDRFEKACQAGKPPLIEEALLQVPSDERERLLGELLEIEMDFRQRGGAFLQLEEYRGRFPESAELVESVFHRVVKTRRLGDYELLEELGRGGMGVVYKARQVYLNQTVAVKILPYRYLDEPQALFRFRREMQSIGSLDHPNIVRAYNAGEAGGVQYLVMEFVDGVNLQQLVGMGAPPGGPLAVGAACEIIRQAALGLQHAHEHQLVHRDVKPANLMLCRNRQVKLLDLGLAKFHAERRGEDRLPSGLTQPGVTMGTIDYMAPEQWENPATADIRADIYSLGCTLFFLLTGEPPYGDPAYDTGRKKLMAQAVAPIPSLPDHGLDCPAELEEVYETMMAKEPRQRFAVPAEVAEAMREFAEEEELAQVIAALPADARIAAGKPALHDSGADTARPQGSRGEREKGRKGEGEKGGRGEGQRARLFPFSLSPSTMGTWCPPFVLACLMAGVLGLWAWRTMRPAGEPAKNSTTSGATLPATAAPTLDPNQLAAELALLPGLNGPWWFAETPWLTPFLREAIAEKVRSATVGQAFQPDTIRQAFQPDGTGQAGKSDGARQAGKPDLRSADLTAILGDRPRGYLSSHTAEAQKWLWAAAEGCRGSLSPRQSQLLDRLKAFADSDPGDDEQAAKTLENALQEFIDARRDGKLPAADLHTVALLQHGMAALRSDKALALAVKKSYDQALEAYAAEKQTPAPTRLLCLVDSASLCAEMLGDFQEAKQRLDEALAAGELPVLFHVSTLVARGDLAAAAATGAGEYEDRRFLHAKRLLEDCRALKPSHPLAAYLAERYAWSLMDQWKVEEAAKQFQAAYHIRLTNKGEKDPLAAIYVFHDRHGMAMAARYRGYLGTARRMYKSVVDEVAAALDEAQRRQGAAGQRGRRAALRARLANSRERLADCELYSGAASDGKVNLSLAAEYYAAARTTADDRSDSLVLGCKLAIIQALDGRQKAAREVLNGLDADKRPALGSSVERAALVRQVADAALALTGAAPQEGHKALRRFLDQFKLRADYRDTSRRETLELQLLAAEMLLAWDLENQPQSAARELKYLDALLAVFKERREIRPFLRRYYELAVRACNRGDLVQIAHYLIESRMDERQGMLDEKTTLVLFSFTPRENFAVFLPRDGRAGKRIALDVTRDQIKGAKGKPLRLNEDLVASIQAELAAGRRVEVFWDDTASRASEDPEALSDRDWPFDVQLELARLRAAPAAP